MTRARSRAIYLVSAAIAVLAAVLEWRVVLPMAGPDHAWWPMVLVLLAAGFLASEMFVVHLRLGREAYAFSFMEVPLVLGLFFARPDLLVVSRLVGAGIAFLLQRKDPQKALFNSALFALETVGAVVVFHAVLGGRDPIGPAGWVATGAAALFTSVLGLTLISLMITIATGQQPRTLGEVYSVGPLGDLANACFALVSVYILSADWHAGWLLAVVVGVLYASYRAYEAAYQRSETLAQVNRFTTVVGHEVGLEAVAHDVLTEVAAALQAEHAEMRLDDGDRPRSWCLVDGDVVQAETPMLSHSEDRTDRTGAPPARRAADGAALAELRAVPHDYLRVPLRSEGRLLGSLLVADRLGDLGSFGRDDLGLLSSLANHAAVALDNARRSQQLIEQANERERLALHDDLTGLPNRRLFARRLEEALARGRTAVLLLDLDGFKLVNDTLGHEVGDRLLHQVATRLLEAAGSSTIARFGGDEFAVLLPGADDLEARACASVLREALGRPFDLDGIAVAADASFGVALGERGDQAATVLRWADLATYEAKQERVGVAVYTPELDRQDVSRLGLLADLRSAIAGNTLEVVYQPKWDVATGAVEGVEALARWNHPVHGPVGPDEFIPMAEHSSLITPLTALVLRRTLADAERLRALVPDLGVAVNISPRSLLSPTFVDEVASVLAGSSLPPQALTLEITETSLMAEPERAIDALRRLRGLGVRLSVDDLGTGYSSLSYLQRLPVDEVKIDRSFFTDFADPDAQAVVGAIVELGHRLGRRVVAEGIEDGDTLAALRLLGCDSAQGFHLARPLSISDVTDLLHGLVGTPAAPVAPGASLRLIR